ncbi:endonuclease/exonuclease/phosphatase family protein [Longitalea luteola]|uniref:endonuclease/exonuclease/phosphatase family protein n=1 Tax=Longitalea luteola TaxID=2812563 RepID=UPI001A96096C|nr:endonuclease/exonuclease/phosphatase family protein [Longitalea luteola]
MAIKKITLLTIAFFCVASVFSQSMVIGTYNIRYDNPRDTGNLWVNRAPIVASLIRFHDFDVLGTQEGLRNQLDDLKNALPEYTYYGVGRDDGQTKGEHSAIFYKTEKYKVLKSGDFWLSSTPEKPGPGWDARLNRICSWLQLQDKKTKKKFYFFNVHYDHQGVQARRESSLLILKKIKEIAGNAPAIFTGDLNGGYDSEWYKSLSGSGWLKDTHNQVAHPYANNGSFNSFGNALNRSEIIDHIFVTAPFTATKWGILSDHYHGKFPSDHYPVLAVIKM